MSHTEWLEYASFIQGALREIQPDFLFQPIKNPLVRVTAGSGEGNVELIPKKWKSQRRKTS